jgi:hypothetical protein
MDNFNIGVPFTLFNVNVCTTIFFSFFHFFWLIFGVSPKYHRIKNEKNEARPFKSEMPIKMHVSHLQNGLPFAEERLHSIKWPINACNSFAKTLHGHKPRNVQFGASYLYW